MEEEITWDLRRRVYIVDVSAVWIQRGAAMKKPSDLDLGRFLEKELQVAV